MASTLSVYLSICLSVSCFSVEERCNLRETAPVSRMTKLHSEFIDKKAMLLQRWPHDEP